MPKGKTGPKTKHTSYRLTETTRRRLADIALLEGITSTQAVNNLIHAEYGKREAEIIEMKENRRTNTSN
jgi:hypothetical protein